MLGVFHPLRHPRFGGAPLLQECELASPVGVVAFRRRPRPVGADGRGVAVPEFVEVVAGLDKEAERVDAVEMLEDEEVDFRWEGEEQWHALATEILWLWCFGIGSHRRTAGLLMSCLLGNASRRLGVSGVARFG